MAEPSSRVVRYVSTQGYKPRRPPVTVEDRDACALYAAVEKDATPSGVAKRRSGCATIATTMKTNGGTKKPADMKIACRNNKGMNFPRLINASNAAPSQNTAMMRNAFKNLPT